MRSFVISALSLLCLALWMPVTLTAKERDRSKIPDQYKFQPLRYRIHPIGWTTGLAKNGLGTRSTSAINFHHSGAGNQVTNACFLRRANNKNNSEDAQNR